MTLSMQIIYAARHLLTLGHSVVSDGHPDLSESDVSVLLSVKDEPGLTAKTLADRLSRDKTTISRAVARLSGEGFLRSEIDSLDGRRRNLFLTDAGREVANLAAHRICEDIERLTDQMSLKHVELITEFLRKLPEKR